MSFPTKFKLGGSNTNDLPQGVNIENTSFGYQQNQKPYIKPPMQNNQANVQKTKPRGGWDDDDEDDGSTQIRGGNGQFKTNQPTQQSQSIQQVQSPVSTHSGGSEDPNLGPKTKKINPADFELIQIDENFVASHEFENRTINDLIQPGGARMKQPDSALNGFCKAAESFPAPVIGSLLLSKLNEEIPFVSKARILFLLEAIVKKVKKYYDYFHHNLEILRQFDFSGEGMNGNQLKKLLDDIIKYIEEPNKPKPVPVYNTPANLIATPSSTSANLLDDDLLAGPSQPKKQDPFEFIKSKQTSDSSNSQQSQGSASHQQQHFELLDAPVESQPFPQQQSQPQPKKFDPFGLSNNNSNSSPFPTANTSQQNTAKPSGGLPGNFKKFQAGASSQATPTNNNTNQNLLDGGFSPAPTNTNNVNTTSTKFDQLDDLLNDLTIGSNDSASQPSTNQQQQNAPSQQNQNQGFGTPSSNQGQNQGQNQGFGTPQNNQQFAQNNFPSQQNQQGFNNNQGQNQNQGKPGQQQQQGGFPQQQNQGGFPQQYQQGYPQQYQQGYPQQYPQGYPQQYPQGYPQQYQQGYPQQYPQGGYPQQFPGYGYGQMQGQGQFGGQNFQGQPGFNQNQGNQGNNTFNNWQPGKK